ncbi:hypothetical protein BV25DRAFT_1640635 [Artomyces pyxidatus]|uniref:Uncharacterized protein n=1 Tax=Artomyces pyxidatus TaxID=48021 RepID=A0ACB8SIL0_9AGAM|nr:hypothetical protein BV25DRAFT_1640635 [Artomyces pyxidatus]
MKQPAPAPALPEKAEHKSTPSKDETSAAIARAEEKKAAAEARSSKSSSSSDDTTKPSTGNKGPSVKGSGYDTDYHPAAEHPPPADMDTAVPSTTEADTVGGHGHQKGGTEKTQANSDPDPKTGESAVKEAAGGGPGSGRHETEENQKHKVGVMSKVKGEVQVLVGKVTKNSDKVDEGRKLKEGRN